MGHRERYLASWNDQERSKSAIVIPKTEGFLGITDGIMLISPNK